MEPAPLPCSRESIPPSASSPRVVSATKMPKRPCAQAPGVSCQSPSPETRCWRRSETCWKSGREQGGPEFKELTSRLVSNVGAQPGPSVQITELGAGDEG